MKYGDYLRTIATHFDSRFSEITAEHGFEYGSEFEIALCKAFRAVLPQSIGICRGYVVPEDGEPAGDDLIIYDRQHFPVLRMLEQDSFEQKQQVPVDAVYAYIEAKHTLIIEGTERASLAHAIDQVRNVQSLDGVERDDIRMTYYTSGINETCFDRNSPPAGRSPVFGAVFSRFVKIKSSDKNPANPEEIRDAMRSGYCDVEHGRFIREEDLGLKAEQAEPDYHPDLVVAGCDNILLPFIERRGFPPRLASPFIQPGLSRLFHAICTDLAFAMGICTLLWALEMSHLGRMPWPILLGEAFVAGKPLSESEADSKLGGGDK